MKQDFNKIIIQVYQGEVRRKKVGYARLRPA